VEAHRSLVGAAAGGVQVSTPFASAAPGGGFVTRGAQNGNPPGAYVFGGFCVSFYQAVRTEVGAAIRAQRVQRNIVSVSSGGGNRLLTTPSK